MFQGLQLCKWINTQMHTAFSVANNMAIDNSTKRNIFKNTK
jgi:hypothetical protein